MTLSFTDTGWEDYSFWQDNDSKLLLRINELIKDIKRNPVKGLGKPEPLGRNLSGWWSRKINNGHRLIYKISGTKPDQILTIMQARYHH